MALVAWYPLDKDLKNYGVSENGTDLDSTGVTTNDNGKLGKCFYFQKDGSTINNYLEELNGAKIFSFGCWVNVEENNQDWGKILFFQATKEGETPSYYGLRLESAYSSTENAQIGIYGTTTEKHYIMEKDIGSKNEVTSVNEWHHFTFVADGDNCYFYKDGIIIGNCKQESSGYLTGYFNVGCQIGGSFPCHCYMNDLRIYNHALSQSEVQEIYRSLILKYSFDTPVEDPKISTVTRTDISSLLNGKENQCFIIGDIEYDKDYIVENNYVTISFDLNIKDIETVEENRGILTLQSRSVINGSSKWGTLVKTSNELYGRSGALRIYRRNGKLY